MAVPMVSPNTDSPAAATTAPAMKRAAKKDKSKINLEFMSWVKRMPSNERKDKLQQIVSGKVLGGTSAKLALSKLQSRPEVRMQRVDFAKAMADFANQSRASTSSTPSSESVPDACHVTSTSATKVARQRPCPLSRRPCPLSRKRRSTETSEQPKSKQRIAPVEDDTSISADGNTSAIADQGPASQVSLQNKTHAAEDQRSASQIPAQDNPHPTEEQRPTTESRIQAKEPPVSDPSAPDHLVQEPSTVEPNNSTRAATASPQLGPNGHQMKSSFSVEISSTSSKPQKRFLTPGVVDLVVADAALAIASVESLLSKLNEDLEKDSLSSKSTETINRLLECSTSIGFKADVVRNCVERGVMKSLGSAFYPKLLQEVQKNQKLNLYSNMRLMSMVNMLLGLTLPNSDPKVTLNALVAKSLYDQRPRAQTTAESTPQPMPSTAPQLPSQSQVSVIKENQNRSVEVPSSQPVPVSSQAAIVRTSHGLQLTHASPNVMVVPSQKGGQVTSGDQVSHSRGASQIRLSQMDAQVPQSYASQVPQSYASQVPQSYAQVFQAESQTLPVQDFRTSSVPQGAQLVHVSTTQSVTAAQAQEQTHYQQQHAHTKNPPSYSHQDLQRLTQQQAQLQAQRQKAQLQAQRQKAQLQQPRQQQPQLQQPPQLQQAQLQQAQLQQSQLLQSQVQQHQLQQPPQLQQSQLLQPQVQQSQLLQPQVQQHQLLQPQLQQNLSWQMQQYQQTQLQISSFSQWPQTQQHPQNQLQQHPQNQLQQQFQSQLQQPSQSQQQHPQQYLLSQRQQPQQYLQQSQQQMQQPQYQTQQQQQQQQQQQSQVQNQQLILMQYQQRMAYQQAQLVSRQQSRLSGNQGQQTQFYPGMQAGASSYVQVQVEHRPPARTSSRDSGISTPELI